MLLVENKSSSIRVHKEFFKIVDWPKCSLKEKPWFAQGSQYLSYFGAGLDLSLPATGPVSAIAAIWAKIGTSPGKNAS